MNEDGVHILVGIVSSKDTCSSEQDYAVFANVSAFLPWIKSSIKENGGMVSCSFNISAPPTNGMSALDRKTNFQSLFYNIANNISATPT